MINLSMSRRMFLGASAGAFVVAISSARAAKLNLSNGVAIQGYDPVAYFANNSAAQGDASITADYEGATYQFTSAENRDAFLADPAKYAPQYGGFCAYAVSEGYTAPIDPQAFSVVENKLYLNYSTGVRTLWSKDIAGNIQKADANWPGLSAQ